MSSIRAVVSAVVDVREDGKRSERGPKLTQPPAALGSMTIYGDSDPLWIGRER